MLLHTKIVDVYQSECGPDARFVLEAMALGVSRGDGDGRKRYSSKALAKWLRVSEKLASDALAELVAIGAVERVSTISGAGRPSITYEIPPSKADAVKEQYDFYGMNTTIIEQLFSGAEILTGKLGALVKTITETATLTKAGKPTPPGARSRLSAANRLLLGALLSRADRFGAVYGLGSSELMRLTGLDNESLKHRLKRLGALGLIRSYVPGASSVVFRVKKVPSIYFLNLDHPGFGWQRRCGVLVHISARDEKRISFAEILMSKSPAVGYAGSMERDEKKQIVAHFLRGQEDEVFDLLEVVLFRYASELLQRFWYELGVDRPIDTAGLHEQIFDDLQKPPSEESTKVEADHRWDTIISFFVRLVVDIAKDYRTRFGQASWIEYSPENLSILPVKQKTGQIIIAVVLVPVPRGIAACTVLRETRLGVAEIRDEYWSESEMPLERRVQCGLASPIPRRLMAKKSF